MLQISVDARFWDHENNGKVVRRKESHDDLVGLPWMVHNCLCSCLIFPRLLSSS